MLNYLQNFLLKVGILLNLFFKVGAMMHYIREQAVLLVMMDLVPKIHPKIYSKLNLMDVL